MERTISKQTQSQPPQSVQVWYMARTISKQAQSQFPQNRRSRHAEGTISKQTELQLPHSFQVRYMARTITKQVESQLPQRFAAIYIWIYIWKERLLSKPSVVTSLRGSQCHIWKERFQSKLNRSFLGDFEHLYMARTTSKVPVAASSRLSGSWYAKSVRFGFENLIIFCEAHMVLLTQVYVTFKSYIGHLWPGKYSWRGSTIYTSSITAGRNACFMWLCILVTVNAFNAPGF